jgi:hypothetical protein
MLRSRLVSRSFALLALSIFWTLHPSSGPSVSARTASIGSAAAAASPATIPAYGDLSTSFIQNHGQAPSEVRFLSATGGAPIFFTDRDVRLVLARDGRRAALFLEFVGARDAHLIRPEERSGSFVNHLIGADVGRWKSGLPTYRAIRYSNVWPGIDAVFRGGDEALKYELVVRPGADPSRIRLRYRGGDAIRLTPSGELALDTAAGSVIDSAPTTYQMRDDGRYTPVESRYYLDADGAHGFKLGLYDTSRPLVIDPSIVYSTFLGGSAADQGNAIAVDATGNAYVAGSTRSADFPVTPGAYDTSWGGGATGIPPDAFVAKLNATGTALVYLTYLGGFASDEALGIAVDAAGSAYVTGYTESSDFPATPGALQTSIGSGGRDAFVAKLNAAGTDLVYSTFVGANAATNATAIAVDAAGAANITGDTLASNLPTTTGAIHAARIAPGRRDGFLLKLAPSGSSVSYGTYIGGSQEDLGTGVAIDGSGYSYVVGHTYSSDLRTSANAIQPEGNPSAYKSGDAGDSFIPMHNGLRVRRVTAFAVDPQLANVIYAGTDEAGLFTSNDGGASWTTINGGLPSSHPAVHDIAIQPRDAAVLVAVTSGGIYKSTDSGSTWRWVLSNAATRVVFAPSDPQVLYAASNSGGLKSVDGGESWMTVLSLAASAVAVDPRDAGIVYFGTQTAGVSKSIDGGSTWTAANNGLPSFSRHITALGLDPASPTVLYAAVQNTSAFKTSDGGASWFGIENCCSDVTRFTFDARDSRVLYASGENGIDKTTDGASWQKVRVRGIWGMDVHGFAASAGTLFAGSLADGDGFAYKIATGGTAGLIYGTYLGGSYVDRAQAIAVEANGNASIAVQTYSPDFPFTRRLADSAVEAAIVKLEPSGSRFIYASPLESSYYTYVRAIAVDRTGTAYLAASENDQAPYVRVDRVEPRGMVSSRVTLDGAAGVDAIEWPSGIAVDAGGDVYLAGTTNATNFPVSAGASQQNYGGGRSDAFITKLSFKDVGAVNLALGRTAVASSVEGTPYGASYAVDGNSQTRWSSQFSDPQWIYVDLGARYDVDRVVLHWETAFARFYDLQISDDAINWTPLASQSWGSDGGIDNWHNLTGTGRYVRMYGRARATPWGYSLWEIEIYGTPSSSPPPPPASVNLALKRFTFASSVEGPGLEPMRAVDGSLSTRWSSQFSDPQWIAVDLGQAIDITRVVLRWEMAYGADYQIQVSNDKSTWSTVRAVVGGDGGVDDLTGLSGSGRYVRMYGTRRGTHWGYSLLEFEVFGTFAETGGDIVLYAADAKPQHLRGWFKVADPSSPNGTKLATNDAGWSSTETPGTGAGTSVDFSFTPPQAGTYKIWLRLKATGNSKWNDSVWVQFSDASVNGSPVYRLASNSALLVNLEDCFGCGPSEWGWQDNAWWLSQSTVVALARGPQTIRILTREDGVQLDQIVLSPARYLSSPPGPVKNDTTIVAK